VDVSSLDPSDVLELPPECFNARLRLRIGVAETTEQNSDPPHIAARRRGGMAARGAGAIAGEPLSAAIAIRCVASVN